VPQPDELAAAEGVVREAVPGSARVQAAPQVPAVYLPPFIRPNGPKSVSRNAAPCSCG
jgi:hypothetical protein